MATTKFTPRPIRPSAAPRMDRRDFSPMSLAILADDGVFMGYFRNQIAASAAGTDRNAPGWRIGAALGALLTIGALAGCTASPPAAMSSTAPPGATGTIVSAREVILQIAGAEGGVLGALGAPASAGETLAPATEFIVRETNGTIISVMQPQPTSLHPGERVRILRGVTTRLAPLETNPAA
ncbi:hypothetical protein [Acidiphilium sp.]|uniref:hypothetical protein n=1 Tax=Acidiphilium sp. TaxID=527 RepID=UPI003CFDB60C